MNMNSLKDELKQLIAQGEIELVLKKLMDIAKGQKSDTSNLIYSLSSSYNKYKKEINFGVLSEEKAKEFANELTYRLLNIVDELEEHPEAANDSVKNEADVKRDKIGSSEKTRQPDNEEVRIPKRNFLNFALLLLGILFIGIVFKYLRPDTDDKKIDAKENWVEIWQGEWEHQSFTAEKRDVITKGFITLKSTGSQLEGSGVFIYPNPKSPNANITLSNLAVNENRLTGHWQTDLIDPKNPQKGTFEFVLSKNKDAFEGTYNLSLQPGIKHHWNGKKK
jgi:Effector-associated domain 11